MNYKEEFNVILKHGKIYDQIDLNLSKIALSVRVDGLDDPKVNFKIASAFDQARFRLFNNFAERGIFNMMTDSEAETLFMTYLNERLQVYFPSRDTFALQNHTLMWVGDPPSSTVTFIGPFYNPN